MWAITRADKKKGHQNGHLTKQNKKGETKKNVKGRNHPVGRDGWDAMVEHE